MQSLTRDIELVILTDTVDAGSVYVDLEGWSPRILADINDQEVFAPFANRFFKILETLHARFRSGGDGAPRQRGLTYSFDSSKASNHQRLEARKALKKRLESAGCAPEQVEELMAPSV